MKRSKHCLVKSIGPKRHTVGWWLLKLDEPYRTAAIKGSTSIMSHMDRREYGAYYPARNMHEALYWMFPWHTVPSPGELSWAQLHLKYAVK